MFSFKKRASGDVPTPAADKVTVFVDDNGNIKRKDEAGTVEDLASGGIPESVIDAAGDLIVGDGADSAARLAKGTALQVLRVNAGATALEWGDASSSGIPETIVDAAGDLIVGDGADSAARLAVGDEDDVLTVVAGVPAWSPAQGGTTVVVDFATKILTSGSFALNSGSWADVNNTALDMTLAAAAGDYVEYSLSGGSVTGSQSTDALFDVVAVASGTSLSGAGGAAGRGIKAFYFRPSVAEGNGGSIILPVALVSGDISAGEVTVRLRYRQGVAGSKSMYGTTDAPFIVSAKTLRPPA